MVLEIVVPHSAGEELVFKLFARDAWKCCCWNKPGQTVASQGISHSVSQVEHAGPSLGNGVLLGVLSTGDVDFPECVPVDAFDRHALDFNAEDPDVWIKDDGVDFAAAGRQVVESKLRGLVKMLLESILHNGFPDFSRGHALVPWLHGQCPLACSSAHLLSISYCL